MTAHHKADLLGRHNNRVIQTLWIGELSPLEQMCMTSFVQQGHEVHLYVYEEPADVPNGVTVRDAEAILPAATIVRNQRGRGRGSYACFADLFRYTLLWNKGGWWVDADVFCLRPFDFPEPYVFGAEDKPVANGVIKAPAGCELMRRCQVLAAEMNLRDVVWNELGDIFAEAVFDLALDDYILPADRFSPIPYNKVVDTVRGKASFAIPDDSYAVHLYNEMWRRNRVSKYRTYPRTSLFEHLRRRTGMSPPKARHSNRIRSWLEQVPRIATAWLG